MKSPPALSISRGRAPGVRPAFQNGLRAITRMSFLAGLATGAGEALGEAFFSAGLAGSSWSSGSAFVPAFFVPPLLEGFFSAGGGGSSGSTSTPLQTVTFTGTLNTSSPRGYEIVVTRSGTLTATLQWDIAQLELILALGYAMMLIPHWKAPRPDTSLLNLATHFFYLNDFIEPQVSFHQ